MEDRLQIGFSQAAQALTGLFREIQTNNNKKYSEGREKAAEELLNWCEALRSEQVKYVPVNQFLERLQTLNPNVKIHNFPEVRKRTRD